MKEWRQNRKKKERREEEGSKQVTVRGLGFEWRFPRPGRQAASGAVDLPSNWSYAALFKCSFCSKSKMKDELPRQKAFSSQGSDKSELKDRRVKGEQSLKNHLQNN